MTRAILKGSVLFVFGNFPGGAKLYRILTRSALGTQATHVDKLKRVWPGYVRQWVDRCGLELEGAQIGIYEGGWTPFPNLISFLLTGNGGWVVNHESRLQERYLRHALEAAVSWEVDGFEISESRNDLLSTFLKEGTGLTQVMEVIRAHVLNVASPATFSPGSATLDLIHSGGVLEHLPKDELQALIGEFWKALAPGGICSHVFDHRDHLYHADKRYPYLNHLRYSRRGYRALFGHPLLFHSRILPHKVVDQFERAGFQRVAVRRLILPSSQYVEEDSETLKGLRGLDRDRLHADFSAASEVDLHTAAAHYLFRKPD